MPAIFVLSKTSFFFSPKFGIIFLCHDIQQFWKLRDTCHYRRRSKLIGLEMMSVVWMMRTCCGIVVDNDEEDGIDAELQEI